MPVAKFGRWKILSGKLLLGVYNTLDACEEALKNEIEKRGVK